MSLKPLTSRNFRKADGWTDEEKSAILAIRQTGLTVGLSCRSPYAYECYFDPNYHQKAKDLCHDSRGPGMGIEFAQTLCDRLEVKCKFVLNNLTFNKLDPTQSQWGWVGKINDGEIDTSLPWLYETEEKRQILDFTMPVFYMEAGLLIKTQYNIAGDFWFVIQPFHWHVWMTITLCLVIMALLDSGIKQLLFTKGKGSFKEFGRHLEKSCFEHLAMLLQRGLEIKTWQTPRRMIHFAWGFASLIFGAAYGGFLVSSQVAAMAAPPFTDLTSLAQSLASREYRLLIYYPSSFVLDQIKKSTAEATFVELRNALEINKPEIINDVSDIVDRIAHSKENLVFWSSQYNLKALARQNCNVTIIPLQFTDFGSFAFRKSTKLANVFTKLIVNFKDKGYYLERLEQKYGFGRSCEQVKQMAKQETYKVSLPSLQAIFLALIFGLCLSGSLLMGEIIHQPQPSITLTAVREALKQAATAAGLYFKVDRIFQPRSSAIKSAPNQPHISLQRSIKDTANSFMDKRKKKNQRRHTIAQPTNFITSSIL